MKRSPIRKVSAKRAAKLRGYDKARAEVARRSGGRCEIRGPVCTGRHEHTHHVRMRSQGGADLPYNLVACCNADHRYVHEHPEWAYEHGWLARTTFEPESSAVVRVEKVER